MARCAIVTRTITQKVRGAAVRNDVKLLRAVKVREMREGYAVTLRSTKCFHEVGEECSSDSSPMVCGIDVHAAKHGDVVLVRAANESDGQFIHLGNEQCIGRLRCRVVTLLGVTRVERRVLRNISGANEKLRHVSG